MLLGCYNLKESKNEKRLINYWNYGTIREYVLNFIQFKII